MNKFIKIKVLLLVILFTFSSKLVAADRILPLPKPTPDKEIKEKTEAKKKIYPKKKPNVKKQNQLTDSNENTNVEKVVKARIMTLCEQFPLYSEDNKM